MSAVAQPIRGGPGDVVGESFVVVQGERTVIPQVNNADIAFLRGLAPRISTEEVKTGIVVSSRAWAGTVQLSSYRLEIRPKIHPAEWKEILFRMLSQPHDETAVFFQRQTRYAATTDFLYELVVRFLGEVRQLLGDGLGKGYVREKDRLPALRGQIDFRRFEWPLRDARIPCVYFDRSINNLDNQLLKRALVHVARVLIAPRIRSEVEDLLDYFAGVTATDTRTRIVYNRLNERYRPAHHIAGLLLDHLSVAFAEGRAPFSSFLVDMESLFESFVSRIVVRHFSGMQVRTHPPFMIRGNPDNRFPRLRLIPDIVVFDGEERPKLVIDTKYKAPTTMGQFGTEQLRNPDIYQILSYSIRTRCPAILVYPQQAYSDAPLTDKFEIEGNKIRVMTFDLRMILQNEFSGFTSRLEQALTAPHPEQ